MDDDLNYYKPKEKQIVKIQSFFRGHTTRQQLKNKAPTQKKNSAKYFDNQKDNEAVATLLFSLRLKNI